MGVVAMGMEFVFSVEHTVQAALDYLTRRKAFAIVRDMPGGIGELSTATDIACYRLIKKDIGQNEEEPSMFYLVVGESVHSREEFDEAVFADMLAKSLCAPKSSISTISIRELYELSQDHTLECKITAKDGTEANDIWLNERLGFGQDLGKHYINVEGSELTCHFQPISSASYENDGQSHEERLEKKEGIDIARFSLYDDMFEAVAETRFYGDSQRNPDMFVEYSIKANDNCTRYMAVEFFSNHSWALDPVTVLVLSIKAELLEEPCNPDDARFTHPTKTVYDKMDKSRCFLKSITTKNNMKNKFSSGRGEDKAPDTLVSADRAWDNAVDFRNWLSTYYQEISLI